MLRTQNGEYVEDKRNTLEIIYAPDLHKYAYQYLAVLIDNVLFTLLKESDQAAAPLHTTSIRCQAQCTRER